jgi:hypothetical protein
VLTSPPYTLQDIRGIAGPRAESHVLSAPYQHGGTLVDVRLVSRPIHIPLKVQVATEQAMWEARRTFLTALNPTLGVGVLTLVRPSSQSFSISATVEEADFPSARAPLLLPASIDLLAPNPYWYATTQLTQAFNVNTEAVLTNSGDVPQPIEVTFNGPSTNPKITNETTGELIEIIHTLVSGEDIIVRTGFGAPSVVRVLSGVTTDAMHMATIGSRFFSLVTGANTIAYDVASGTGVADVARYTWYSGI